MLWRRNAIGNSGALIAVKAYGPSSGKIKRGVHLRMRNTAVHACGQAAVPLARGIPIKGSHVSQQRGAAPLLLNHTAHLWLGCAGDNAWQLHKFRDALAGQVTDRGGPESLAAVQHDLQGKVTCEG